MINTQFVKSPSKNFFHLIQQRISRYSRKDFQDQEQGISYDAVGLVHGNIIEVLAAVDIAGKAAKVSIFELMGSCQQHFNTIAIFGDVASVDLALQAINTVFNKKKQRA